jgi:nucleotide-binding universal stress UspA family protein
MVQLDIDAPAEPRIRFAWEIARRFESDLIGFAAGQPRGYFGVSEGAAVEREMMRRQIEDIETRLKEIRNVFLEVTADSEQAAWRGMIEHPTLELLKHSRAADLIVSGTQANGAIRDTFRNIDPGSLVLGAGRPVLFVADGCPALHAAKILVCWKDTRESRRAIRDAMPFLVHADEVLAVTVDESDGTLDRDGMIDVQRYLVKHGVKASSETIKRGHSSVGEKLSNAAKDFGADLVVSGGFGHSRLREWVLGGATHSLMQDVTVHRLMSN